MQAESLRAIVRPSVLLLIVSVGVATSALADELPEPGPEAEFANPADRMPPNPLPDYAPRAKVETHFHKPTRSFSLFHSLTSYGTACRERCLPKMFAPRGVGVARRTSCHRMDYSPYVAEHTDSNHGPSYYKREHLVPCQHPKHCEHHGLHWGWPVYY